MKATFNTTALLLFVLCVATACATPSSEKAQARPTFGQLRLSLESHLDGCTQSFGTDPTEAKDVGDFELVQNERAWLDCAYQGIETIMMPNSDQPDLYRNFIAESRALTDLVERREITRAQRKTRIHKLVAEIEDAEIASLVRREPGISQAQQRVNEELVRETLDSFRTLVVPRRTF